MIDPNSLEERSNTSHFFDMLRSSDYTSKKMENKYWQYISHNRPRLGGGYFY